MREQIDGLLKAIQSGAYNSNLNDAHDSIMFIIESEVKRRMAEQLAGTFPDPTVMTDLEKKTVEGIKSSLDAMDK